MNPKSTENTFAGPQLGLLPMDTEPLRVQGSSPLLCHQHLEELSTSQLSGAGAGALTQLTKLPKRPPSVQPYHY